MPVPYRIKTPRSVLRCYAPTDAALLKKAIDESLEHLRPWMPWAKFEPTNLDEKAQRLRLMRAAFDRDEDFTYGIFNPEQDRLLGGCGLHRRRGPRALEIGYWIHAHEVGKGLATEISQGLVHAGFLCFDIDWIEIRCDPKNTASQGVPRKLGFSHEATLKGRDLNPQGQLRDTMVWSLFRQDYAPEDLDIQCFDALGREITET